MEQTGLIIWLTGISGAGKTTISNALAKTLIINNIRVEQLDGDVIRAHLSKGLGFSREDRDENIRRIAYVAGMLVNHGVVVIVSAISPYRSTRDEVRAMSNGSFIEVYVNASVECCRERDVKGLYKAERQGRVVHLTGVSDPYESPLAPEVECCTDNETIDQSVGKIVQHLVARTRYIIGSISDPQQDYTI